VGTTEEKIHETRWEEKLFDLLVDSMKEQDLVVAGRIGDVESNYQLLADLGMHALLSIYCEKEKDFDQVFFKEEMKDLGFHRFFSHKVFTQLEISLLDDITDDEVKGQ